MKEVRSYIKEPFAINIEVFTDYTIPLYVPVGTKEKYQATEGWKMFTNIIEMEDLEPVEGDLNGDGVVNVGDIMVVINIMADGDNDLKGDLNGDGKVNVGDIMAIINIMAGN
jgi:hypothetical protein